MVKENKITAVEEIKTKLGGAELVILAEFKGLKVLDDRELRVGLRKDKAEYKIYKNTMVKKAIGNTIENFDEKLLTGPTSFIFSNDPIAPAKTVAKFAKSNEALKIKGGIYQKKFISKEKVLELASMPSREELLAKLVYMLNSPITRLVNVVQGPLRKLVYALQAVKNTKQ
jgi:large subunit ribosomal protein L10